MSAVTVGKVVPMVHGQGGIWAGVGLARRMAAAATLPYGVHRMAFSATSATVRARTVVR